MGGAGYWKGLLVTVAEFVTTVWVGVFLAVDGVWLVGDCLG